MNDHVAPPPHDEPGTERVPISIPILHADQKKAFYGFGARYRAIRCGRRWGKSLGASALVSSYALRGRFCGVFTPDYKISRPFYSMVEDQISPAIVTANKTEGIMKTGSGGEVEVWTLENDRAGRSRRYHLVVIDEAAFTKPNMMEIWEGSIKPTLLDFQGMCVVTSNTNGVDPENFFWRICNEPRHGFKEYHAPTMSNPLIPLRRPGEPESDWLQRRAEEFVALERSNPPLVFMQEYMAEFVDWRGVAFFSADKWFVDGAPVVNPGIIDLIFVVVDSAIKSGQEHDGTGAVYFGLTFSQEGGQRLYILDYDYVQIDGAFLDQWLKNHIMTRVTELQGQYKARYGVKGVFVEDKNSGTMMVQAAQAAGLPVVGIDTALTAKGKDERAIAVATHHYQGQCKIMQHAFDKVILFKSTEYNHLLRQVTGFRVGDKDAAKRADDLLDCYTYGLSIGLGNYEGF